MSTRALAAWVTMAHSQLTTCVAPAEAEEPVKKRSAKTQTGMRRTSTASAAVGTTRTLKIAATTTTATSVRMTCAAAAVEVAETTSTRRLPKSRASKMSWHRQTPL